MYLNTYYFKASIRAGVKNLSSFTNVPESMYFNLFNNYAQYTYII